MPEKTKDTHIVYWESPCKKKIISPRPGTESKNYLSAEIKAEELNQATEGKYGRCYAGKIIPLI